MTLLALALLSPLPFADKEVTFKGVDGLMLKGTLVRPAGNKLPAVLLLPGSGPTDRNGNQGMLVTDLLKQIADRLASEGIASLRFDKRATIGYQAFWPKDPKKLGDYFSWNQFIGDAKAALKYLQTQPNIDPKRTGVLGHSEGSMFAVQIGKDFAKKPGGPKVLVLMGAPGRTLDPIIREQVAASLGRAKASSEMIKKYADYTDAAIKSIKEKGTVPPNPPAGMQALFNPSSIVLMKSYLTFDPSKNIGYFPGPVLVIQGQKDIQVSAERDTPLLEKALKKRGGVSEVLIARSASHNLKEVGDVNTDPGFKGVVVADAMEKLASWLKRYL